MATAYSRSGEPCMILKNSLLCFITSLLFLVSSSVNGQMSSTLWTSYVPITVRSPYLSSWINTTNVPFGPTVKRAPQLWPVFWPSTGGQLPLGWAGLIRVDNSTTYKWLGDVLGPPFGVAGLNNTVMNNIEITATRTVMSITVGPVDLNVTYFSPIEPSDPVMQSLPFTYFSLTAASNDGHSHDVQVYTDITGEWLSGDRTLSSDWSTEHDDDVVFHKLFLTTPQPFTEIANQAQDVTVYLGSLIDSQTTYQTGTETDCRTQFSAQGVLTKVLSSGPAPINNPFTVYAISKDLGTVSSPTTPAVWAIGMLRDPVVQFATETGAVENRVPYWRSRFNQDQDQDLITAVLQDYPNAVQRADALDAALAKNASAISSHYADLAAISARQAIGATELTLGVAADGSLNMSDTKMFMKNLGPLDATARRVNPVEVIYQSFPFFLSLNTSYGGWLLSPVLEYASSEAWSQSNSFAPRDIGTMYPTATGNTAFHTQGVEQSGNMLVMVLAHARASGDGSLINKHYPLLKTWADYLVNNTSPVPGDQTSADGDSTGNLTNLAIKGIIAIKAMSQISAAIHQDTDAEHYSNVATAYVNTWKSMAMPSGSQQILYNYGAVGSSYALEYNLFADKWLGTDLVDEATYNAETTFLQSLLNANPNGLPIDSQPNTDGNTAWTMFTAMTVTDNSVRNAMIDQIWDFTSKNESQTIFPTEFKLDGTGIAVNNAAGPGVGGIFAPLALALPNVTINAENEDSGGGSGDNHDAANANSKSKVGPIVGGVVGGIGGLLLLFLLGLFFWRRSHRSRIDEKTTDILSGPVIYQAESYDYPHLEDGQAVTAISNPTGLSKSQEVLSWQRTAVAGQSTVPSSLYAPSSDRAIASTADLGTTVAPEEVAVLRAEMANLRQEVHHLQTDRSEFEPPPTYFAD